MKHLELKRLLSSRTTIAEVRIVESLKLSNEFYNDQSQTHYKMETEQALSTSFYTYFDLFNSLDTNKKITFVDLGCGYAKGALVADLFFQDIKTINIDVDAFRFSSIQNIVNEKHLFLSDDLNKVNFNQYDANIYFMYLPFESYLVNFLNYMLTSFNSENVLYVIESHGEMIESLKQFPWISIEATDLKTNRERHFSNLMKVKVIENNIESYRKEYLYYKELIKENICLSQIPFWVSFLVHEELTSYEAVIYNESLNNYWIASLKDLELYAQDGEIFHLLKGPRRLIRSSLSLDKICGYRSKTNYLSLYNREHIRKVSTDGVVLDSLRGEDNFLK